MNMMAKYVRDNVIVIHSLLLDCGLETVAG